ncbi:MAG: ABC transporter ATP-binding protein [Caldilineaceae bacterium]|nr:ABC transporter ATP-binding protein [Caldilineaceae bacterium]
MPAILEADQITKTYAIGDRQIAVLDAVSFAVEPGEFVVIMGSSGSGKSTLLSLLSGLDRPSRGRIRIDGADITDWSEDQLAPIRNRVFGFVFQSFHLVPSLNALENVAFPAELRGDKDARPRARNLLERVGLSDRVTNFPHQLSGGEKQRVAICRALVNKPKIIFADEPTGNLDSTNGAGIIELLVQLHREEQTTLMLVTHAPEMAEHAGRVITLADGKVVSDETRP